MIIRPRPRGWQLLYILRGSIVPAIAPKVLVIGVLSVLACLVAADWRPAGGPGLAVVPFTLLGLVLSIFLSFRNSACHERWWEGRRLWGQLLFETRSLARLAGSVLASDAPLRGQQAQLSIAFAHALAARLRREDDWLAAQPWLDAGLATLKDHHNLPDALLQRLGLALAGPLRDGRLDPVLYAQFEQRLQALASVQAGCERIATTPLPFAYTLLLHRCAWLFCVLLPFALASALGWATPLLSMLLAYAFFGLDQLGEEMEDPFGLQPNDLPVAALVRMVEIDQLAAIDRHPLPVPLQPQGYLLQ